jgi:hypothetical protein
MKGPHGRSRFDLRRLWECPRCGKRDFTGGQVVHRRCRCSGCDDSPTWMCLIEEDRNKKVPTPHGDKAE